MKWSSPKASPAEIVEKSAPKVINEENKFLSTNLKTDPASSMLRREFSNIRKHNLLSIKEKLLCEVYNWKSFLKMEIIKKYSTVEKDL